MDNYDNIDFCLSLLYDYRYNEKKHRCIEFLPIIEKNIKLNDLKKPSNFNYSDILKSLFKFLGKWNGQFHFKLYRKEFQCNLSIGKYEKNINKDNFENKNIKNIKMLYQLSSFTFEIPILLPIMNFDITYHELKKENDKLLSHLDDVYEDDVFFVNITEHYFKMKNLEQYILKKYKTMNLLKWKVLIFNVLYTLSFLQSKFNNFQHNDLTLKSIMIYEKNMSNYKKKYKINDVNFNIPEIDFDIRITNFGNMSLEGDLKPYIDQQMFFYDIKKIVNKINIDIGKELKDFLNDNIDNNNVYPSFLLQKNNFFNQFIIMNSDLSDSSVNEKQEGGNINFSELTDSSIQHGGADDLDDLDEIPMEGGKRHKHHKITTSSGGSSESLSEKILRSGKKISEKLSDALSKFKANGLNSMGIPQNNPSTVLGNPMGNGSSLRDVFGNAPELQGVSPMGMVPPPVGPSMPMLPQGMPIVSQGNSMMPSSAPIPIEQPIMPPNGMPMMPPNGMPMMPSSVPIPIEQPMMPPNGMQMMPSNAPIPIEQPMMPPNGMQMMGGGSKRYRLVKKKDKSFFQ